MKNFLKLTAVLCVIALVAVFAIGCVGGDDIDNDITPDGPIPIVGLSGGPAGGLAFSIDAVEFMGETVNAGFLTMGTNADFAPFEFASSSPWAVNNVDGIDVKIASLIAQALGLQLRVVDMPFDSIIPAIQAGQIDIGIAGMTIREDRLQNVDFTIPYYTAAQVIIAREDSEITNAADLVGLTVGVVVNYTGDFVVSEMDGVEVVRSNSGVESVLELVNGRVDAVVIDRAPAEAMIAQHQGLITVEDADAFSNENYGMAIRQGNTELLNAVDTVLRQMIDLGYIDAISAAYILGM